MLSIPWPSGKAEIVIFVAALKHNVSEEDIRFIASTPKHKLSRIDPGHKNPRFDNQYRSRSMLARGLTSERKLLEIALRKDGRSQEREVWIVFHARYL